MATLSFLNHKFYFAAQSSVETRAAMDAGFRFDPDTLRWVSRSFEKARTLRRFADGSAERKLKRYFITETAAPECITYPDHLSPRTWQIESAWHALTRTPAYIADEAGLGKTATAIMAATSIPGKTLIICPPYLKYNWCDELSAWALTCMPVGTSVGLLTSDNVLGDDICDFTVLPDSLLTKPKIKAWLTKHAPFKWIIIDEAHRYKTSDAQRTESLVGDGLQDAIADFGERLVFLSGTPSPNGKPLELYSIASRLAPEAIGHRTLEEYGRVFCAGHQKKHYERGRPVFTWDFRRRVQLKTLAG